MVVNYTYNLRKPLEEYQKELFKYSFLMSQSYGKVYVHCNTLFIEVLNELSLTPDKIFILSNDKEINEDVFWAYHKIKVYNNRPIGEMHLDIDAVLKEPFINTGEDIITAHLDTPPNITPVINLSKDYEMPFYIKPNLLGFNMSFVIFNNEELKNLYCRNCISFMKNNNPINDNGWMYMVFAEQSFIKQICENLEYSYNFLLEENNYYHLGANKKFLDEELKQEIINKSKQRIKENASKIFCR